MHRIERFLKSAALPFALRPSHSNDEVPVIVFTKAQLLSDIHIRHIAERCANSNTLFVLVLPQLNPQQLTIRAAFSTGKTELIHGHYIRCVSDSTGRSTGLTPEKQLAVEVLYLLLGPLFRCASLTSHLLQSC